MSKLDQMRDQFRERLNLRPVGQTRVHLIKVENNDNNNNMDSKVGKSESYSMKNSIPTLRTNLSQNVNQKSINNTSKVNSNKFNNKLNQFSNYSKNENPFKNDSKKFGEKVDFNQKLIKTPLQWSSDASKDKKLDYHKKFNENTDGMACRYCQRRFALSERLEKHQSVCMSSLDKSRIKFNSFQQRVKGQPNDYLLIYENALKNEPKVEPKKSNWRQKHLYCISAIKTAKGEVNSGPTTSEIMASIQQQCDYCKRRFNDEAIIRHLPICAKLHHKKLLKI